jgi:hypothetical protein
VRETEWFAYGFTVVTSAFRPLFVPTEHISLSYGFRVGHSFWDGVDTELVDAIVAAVPPLQERATFDGLLALASRWQIDLHHAELRLCIGILTGQAPEIEEMTTILRQWHPARHWEPDILDRTRALLDTVDDHGLPEARDMLAARRGGVLAVLR